MSGINALTLPCEEAYAVIRRRRETAVPQPSPIEAAFQPRAFDAVIAHYRAVGDHEMADLLVLDRDRFERRNGAAAERARPLNNRLRGDDEI